MVTSVSLYVVLLGLLYCERGVELIVSRRNARRAVAAGAVEVGRRHYVVMALFHVVFPIACATEVIALRRPFPGVAGIAALLVALAAQGLRWWAVSVLGWRWNTRVLVLPGAAPVTGGPYRHIRHPNYLAVVLEMIAIPVIHGAWITALVFSAGNAALLGVRIRTEERALGPVYAEAFAGRPRFLPRGRHA
ncbi:MAG: isoprenylcysteine carboxylmethyltransferase family protein [Acidobacteriota bacterium]